MAAQSELLLYHAPQSRSSIVRWMLEEVGQPYRLHRLDLDKGDNRRPDYLAINPMGKVPAITHEGIVVTEAAAICCYLADAFPGAGLAPPVGDKRRGTYLRWLFFAPGCVEPAIVDRMASRTPVPPRTIGYGDFDTLIDVVARAVQPGPYLLGPQFTAADVVMGATLRFGTMVQALPAHPDIAAYIERLSRRPALKRAEAKDAELAGTGAGA
jgi:glutathione S-transferase